jgi:hypothetical protein
MTPKAVNTPYIKGKLLRKIASDGDYLLTSQPKHAISIVSVNISDSLKL